MTPTGFLWECDGPDCKEKARTSDLDNPPTGWIIVNRHRKDGTLEGVAEFHSTACMKAWARSLNRIRAAFMDASGREVAIPSTFLFYNSWICPHCKYGFFIQEGFEPEWHFCPRCGKKVVVKDEIENDTARKANP